MRIALYQPEIPQNLGSILRSCACFGLGVDIIGPCGFPLDDRKIKRVGMDYIDHVKYQKHVYWDDYEKFITKQKPKPRIVLLTTKSKLRYFDFTFKENDVLLLGKESGGVPDSIHRYADARLLIPIQQGMRSLNVAISAAIVISEAMRQLEKEKK